MEKNNDISIRMELERKVTIIEAPDYSETNGMYQLFLGGGITNCPDWQSKLIEKIKSADIQYPLDVFNPRRENFPIDVPGESERQITWEYEKLKKSNIICFWFSRGSINPIVLYELGRWGNSQKTEIYIGVDEEYERTQDVLIQTKLSRPDVEVLVGFDNFSNAIINRLEGLTKTLKNLGWLKEK